MCQENIPQVNSQIMDLLSLEVEIAKIRKFVEVETGIKMSRAFFYDIERKMKIYNEERQISAQRLKELSDKIAGENLRLTRSHWRSGRKPSAEGYGFDSRREINKY